MAASRPIDRVIVQALDSDPTTPLEASILYHAPELICTTGRHLATAFNARLQIVADDSLPGGWFRPIRHALRAVGGELTCITNIYPSFEPTVLLNRLLRRRLLPGHNPVEAGSILISARWAYFAARVASSSAGALIPVAVAHHPTRDRRFLLVPPDAQVCDVLEKTGHGIDSLVVFQGDLPRMHAVAPDARISGLDGVLHLVAPVPATPSTECVRCGLCAEVCPTGVVPAGVMDAAQRASTRLARRMGIAACVDCGLCQFVCPSHLPLLKSMREMRRVDRSGDG